MSPLNLEQGVNILVCGIGGQGVMTASEVFSRAALSLGLDVKKTEVAGMAQRGGVVTSHVRIGKRVLSPSIPDGEADVLLGFEPAETMRWRKELRSGGVAMVNTLRQAPPVVSYGLFEYPEDPMKVIRSGDITVYDLDAGAIAKSLGNLKLVNTIMMGAVADHLPFPPGLLKDIIVEAFRVKKPALAELNEKAYEAGRLAASRSVAA